MQCSNCPRCLSLQSSDKGAHLNSTQSKAPLCAHCEFERRIQLYDSLVFDVLPSSDTGLDNSDSNNLEVVSSSLTIGIALQLILQFSSLSKAASIDNDESRRFFLCFHLNQSCSNTS